MDAKVVEDFHGMQMAAYINVMEDKLHRAAQRRVVSLQAKELSKEIRRQLKSADMPYSRARTRASRRVAREKGQKPLQKTVKSKTWNVKKRGILGKIVGPSWPAGAHAHLVERGFIHNKSGRMTRAHWFQRDAEERVASKAKQIAIDGFKEWIRQQRRKGKAVM